MSASSFHLTWGGLPPVLREVAVDLEVVVAPAVPRLYFWALQVGFAGGAAHAGLQWNPRHPGARAVNWGGYATGGGLLTGSPSPLPCEIGDPNTRDWWWEPGRPYRLRVWAPEPGVWRATVDDTVIRDLYAGDGATLRSPIVWSEVFSGCDDPTVAVRWSRFEAVDERGRTVRPDRLLVNYQRDGCPNTTSFRDGDGVLQVTNAARTTAQGTVLDLR